MISDRLLGIGGPIALNKLALIQLVMEGSDRILIRCETCGLAHKPADIQMRKSPGWAKLYFGKRCNTCVPKKEV